MYTPPMARAKILCYDRNGALSKNCYRKNEIIKIKIFVVTKKIRTQKTRLVKIVRQKILENLLIL
jgi:hypothetical protein